VIKLDKDGKAYQEVKYVKLDMLAKNADEKPAVPTNKRSSKQKLSKEIKEAS
jgi:hypothetical protein